MAFWLQLERFSLEDYIERAATERIVGPVPVLYAELLHGRKE